MPSSVAALAEWCSLTTSGFGSTCRTKGQAKADHLLKALDLGSAPNSKLKQAGQLIFESYGGHPGSSAHWVELKDDLTVSLLQARLIDLDLPIRIIIGEYA